MEIKQDERALLQLLLERGQSYGDIASLLGEDEAGVRARARALLTRLGGADPDAEVGISDYLLGQADPIGRADAVRHLQRNPESLELAREIAVKLAAIAPAAELPDLSGEKPGGRRRSPVRARGTARGEKAPDEDPASRPGAGLDQRQQRMIAGLGAGAVILLIAILAIAGVFSGDDEAEATDPAAELGITEVPLSARGGSSASGQATFGQTPEEDFPFVDLQVTGLAQPPRDSTYLLWLLFIREDGSTEVGVPFSPVEVDRNGNFDSRLAFPNELLAFAALATHVDVSLAKRDQVASAISRFEQVNQEVPFLPHLGKSVLRGRIPSLSEEDLADLGLGDGAGAGGDAVPVPAPDGGAAPEGAGGDPGGGGG